MNNTLRTIVMLTAVLSMGGFFSSQQAMAGQVSTDATATINASCSLAPGAFVFGNLDTIADAAGSQEIAVSMTNNALSNSDSSVSVSGANWLDVSTSGLTIMNAINTQFDDDNTTGGPYTGLTVTPQALIVVVPGDNPDTFWIVLAVLNGGDGPGFVGDVDQAITLDFACV